MIDTIRIIGHNSCSLRDGEGLREVLYIANCNHFCDGCHNKKYWNDDGDGYKIDAVVEKLIKNPITDITISGGDGLTIQYENTLELLKRLRNRTSKNIWLFTGYKWEELFALNKNEVLNFIDVLVDGKFDINKRDITGFKGSSNQRIIDVKKSLKTGDVILHE